MLTKGRKEIAEQIKKEFDRVENLQGRYWMQLIKGENIVCEDGCFGSFYNTFNIQDQGISWSTKEKMLEKALSYANTFAKLNEKEELPSMRTMPRFEKEDLSLDF